MLELEHWWRGQHGYRMLAFGQPAFPVYYIHITGHTYHISTNSHTSISARFECCLQCTGQRMPFSCGLLPVWLASEASIEASSNRPRYKALQGNTFPLCTINQKYNRVSEIFQLHSCMLLHCSHLISKGRTPNNSSGSLSHNSSLCAEGSRTRPQWCQLLKERVSEGYKEGYSVATCKKLQKCWTHRVPGPNPSNHVEESGITWRIKIMR